jgi:hypothetical protein
MNSKFSGNFLDGSYVIFLEKFTGIFDVSFFGFNQKEKGPSGNGRRHQKLLDTLVDVVMNGNGNLGMKSVL